MGVIIPYNIDDTIKYTKSKISELALIFYSLNDDLKVILISIIISHVLALYVKDQLQRGNKDIANKIRNEDPIYIDINNIMYMYKGKVSVIRILNELHEVRNILAHDYPTPMSLRRLKSIFIQEDSLRDLFDTLGVQMQKKPTPSPFSAALKMGGD